MSDDGVGATDGAIRAMTKDSAFRMVAIDGGAMARAVVEAQGLAGADERTARLFAEILVGAVLIRETMSPEMRVQAMLRLSDGGQLLADSHPGGMTRGLTGRLQPGDEARLGPGTAMQITRVLYTGELSQGVVEARRDGGLSQALTDYMLVSEQIASTVAVAAGGQGPGGGPVGWARGFIVQILPEAEEESMRLVTERLEALGDLEALLGGVEGGAEGILEAVWGEEVPHVVLERPEVFAGCNCSEVRVLSALTTMGVEEISEIIETGEVLDIDCDYCGTGYRVGPEQLRSLLRES